MFKPNEITHHNQGHLLQPSINNHFWGCQVYSLDLVLQYVECFKRGPVGHILANFWISVPLFLLVANIHHHSMGYVLLWCKLTCLVLILAPGIMPCMTMFVIDSFC